MTAPATDDQLDYVRDLITQLRSGHPQHGHKPVDELDFGTREMVNIWTLNLESCLAGLAPAVVELVDRLRPIVAAVADVDDYGWETEDGECAMCHRPWTDDSDRLDHADDCLIVSARKAIAP